MDNGDKVEIKLPYLCSVVRTEETQWNRDKEAGYVFYDEPSECGSYILRYCFPFCEDPHAIDGFMRRWFSKRGLNISELRFMIAYEKPPSSNDGTPCTKEQSAVLEKARTCLSDDVISQVEVEA